MSVLATVATSLGAEVAKEVIPDLFGRLARGRGKSAVRVAEVAADAVLSATGIAPDTPADKALTALREDPAAYARVREAVASEAIAQIEAETRAIEIAAEDRANARALQAQTGSRAPMALAAVAAAFAFIAMGGTFYLDLHGVQPSQLTVTIITAAIGFFATVIAFFFGSSAGSKQKTGVMSDEIKRLK